MIECDSCLGLGQFRDLLIKNRNRGRNSAGKENMQVE